MKRVLVIYLCVAVGMLALFGVAQAFGLEAVMADWVRETATRPLVATVVGVSLLVMDVLLPVPSTVIMLYLGYALGTVWGTLASLLGGTLSAMTAYGIGRLGGPLLDRQLTAADRARAGRLLARYGLMAVVITRPLPILAETVALLAGASRLGVWRVAAAAAAGLVPVTAIHAWAGARGGAEGELSGGLVVAIFVLVVGLSGVFYLIDQRLGHGRLDDAGAAGESAPADREAD